jgi:hypothetical protein
MPPLSARSFLGPTLQLLLVIVVVISMFAALLLSLVLGAATIGSSFAGCRSFCIPSWLSIYFNIPSERMPAKAGKQQNHVGVKGLQQIRLPCWWF